MWVWAVQFWNHIEKKFSSRSVNFYNESCLVCVSFLLKLTRCLAIFARLHTPVPLCTFNCINYKQNLWWVAVPYSCSSILTLIKIQIFDLSICLHSYIFRKILLHFNSPKSISQKCFPIKNSSRPEHTNKHIYELKCHLIQL